MRTALTLLAAAILFTISPALAEDDNRPSKERYAREMAKKAVTKEGAVKILDSMVGHYAGTVEINGEMHTSTLTINPKFVRDLYYPGYTKLKNSKGEIVYEAATIFTFNIGGMSYIFFYFGSDEYIRTAFGAITADSVEISSPMPNGVQHLRYTKVDEDTLTYEKWALITGAGKRTGDPEQVIVYKKIK